MLSLPRSDERDSDQSGESQNQPLATCPSSAVLYLDVASTPLECAVSTRGRKTTECAGRSVAVRQSVVQQSPSSVAL